jgi:uncharacterized protein YehS (DUF1456 family)
MDFSRTAVPNLKALLRQQDRARFSDRGDDATLPRVFIIYVRESLTAPEEVIGIVRVTRKLTCGIVRRVRRELKLADDAVLRLVSSYNRDPDAQPRRTWAIGL